MRLKININHNEYFPRWGPWLAKFEISSQTIGNHIKFCSKEYQLCILEETLVQYRWRLKNKNFLMCPIFLNDSKFDQLHSIPPRLLFLLGHHGVMYPYLMKFRHWSWYQILSLDHRCLTSTSFPKQRRSWKRPVYVAASLHHH